MDPLIMLFTFHTRKWLAYKARSQLLRLASKKLQCKVMPGKKDVKWDVDWWVVWSIGHDLSLLGPKWRVQVSMIQLGIVEHIADDIWYISVVFGCWVFYLHIAMRSRKVSQTKELVSTQIWFSSRHQSDLWDDWDESTDSFNDRSHDIYIYIYVNKYVYM